MQIGGTIIDTVPAWHLIKFGQTNFPLISAMYKIFRQAPSHSLEGAPEFVLECLDNKGLSRNRYKIFFTARDKSKHFANVIFTLWLSDDPLAPEGVVQWGTQETHIRDTRQRIRWADLPDAVRAFIDTQITLAPLLRALATSHTSNPF